MFKPHKGETQRMMQACILRRSNKRGPQHVLAIGFSPQPPIKISEVGRGRRILRAQPQRSFVFSLGIRGTAAFCKETSECRARFRPIGIEALSVDELRRRALEPFAVGGRLVRG